MNRALWLVCGLLLCAGCAPDRSTVGSETHWLSSCESDSECGEWVCRCGVCTLPCEATEACASLATSAVCIEATDVEGGGCRLGFADGERDGICSRGCRSDADCGDGRSAMCRAGLCLPAAAEAAEGGVGSLLGDGAAADADASRTPSEVGSADAAAGLDSGGPAADAAFGSDGRLGSGRGALAGLAVPQPECPCQSDLAQGAPLPAVGAANAYGRPVPGMEQFVPSSSLGHLGCEFGSLGFWFSAGDECVGYTMCEVPCSLDAECPAVASGSASPRCGLSGGCFLDCRDSRACPEGMACVEGTDGAACYWPFAVLSPQCDSYCEQRPVPRECPSWCASLLMACDPEMGVECCDELECTEEGFCDAS